MSSIRMEDVLWTTLETASGPLRYADLKRAEAQGFAPLSELPVSLRILLENAMRRGGVDDVAAIRDWLTRRESDREISFFPVRVLMPDSSAVPLVADLAAMRDAVRKKGGDSWRVNPLIPVDIVVDHSAITDHAGRSDAFDLNLALEYQRNHERYAFLKWAQNAFDNVRVVPPATGIVHQVNLEFLAAGVQTVVIDDVTFVVPDTLVGMDSHTTMVNSIGVLGWGVGGIEAAAAILGQPISMLLPRVIGCRISGRPRSGVTCTDIVLSLTEFLRGKKVVGCFVEFFGEGLDNLPVSDRATIANMAPEAGATMCFFPPDAATIEYLHATGRSREQVAVAEAVLKAQGIWRPEAGADEERIAYSDRLEFDLSAVTPSMAGPKRPQDRVDLKDVSARFHREFGLTAEGRGLTNGSVVIAAITSCTNTSNARAMIGAGLIARNLRAQIGRAHV